LPGAEQNVPCLVMKPSLIITCEHAGNDVPGQYKYLFVNADEILLSHRGWDPGAFHVAEFIAERFGCSLFACHTTRLLIETNRSRESPELFSEFSKLLTEIQKQTLLDEVYSPYREAVESELTSLPKPIIHLSVHSFTPVMNDQTRDVDIGLLFDPGRNFESAICELWKKNLGKALPGMTIRLNEPYKGTDDGFTTYLRTKFPDNDYAGIEIEVNQKFNADRAILKIQSALVESFPI
jgi:predicted N-formylglutamate amidohydrolase